MSHQTPAGDPESAHKAAAAERAVMLIQPGMKVGLGSGSTAWFAVQRIGELLAAGQLRDILGFATSRATWQEAQRLGIALMSDDMSDELDLTIDGADEVDPQLNLIKGGGGALLREKVVAQASRRKIIIVDETKLSAQLGTRHALPVEVLPYGWRSQARFLEALGAQITIRQNPDGTPFASDSGNMIMDCSFGPIGDPCALAEALCNRAGIVEHGLFLGMATDVIVAGPQGVRHLQREAGENRCTQRKG
jgi:ribose 5-phosphate isomerase A